MLVVKQTIQQVADVFQLQKKGALSKAITLVATVVVPRIKNGAIASNIKLETTDFFVASLPDNL